MDVSEVFLSCVDEWAKDGLDSRLENAIEMFEEWVEDFEPSEQELLAKLMDKYSYYSQNSVTNIIKKLSQDAVEDFGVSNEDSVISVVRKANGKFNSSYEYWLLHRMLSGLSKEIYFDSVNDIDEDEWKNVKKVVYVDDCSGTGRQFVKFMKRQKKSFLNKEVILIVIEAVEDAQMYIKNELKKQGISVEILSYTDKEKALKSMLENEKYTFQQMSQKHQIPECFVLGFEEAEALMSFYNNTPNDTLGLFWFISEKNEPIFPRDLEEKPGWKLSKDEKSKRRREQYEAKCI